MQSPLALDAISPVHSPNLIENEYLTGVRSTKDPNVSTYTIFTYLAHDANKNTIKTIIISQLKDMQKAGLPTSTSGLEALQVIENSVYPV